MKRTDVDVTIPNAPQPGDWIVKPNGEVRVLGVRLLWEDEDGVHTLELRASEAGSFAEEDIIRLHFNESGIFTVE